MTDKEQKAAAKKFAEYWKNKGYEKGESQPFWLSLLRDVYGVAEPEKFIAFEEQAHIDAHTGFIDGYIHNTKVMIEQKALGKDLRKAIKQSDGSLLNPFQQARRYITDLPVSLHPRWVVTCNFEEFLIYDMEKPNCEPEQIFLKDLPKEYYRLNFLTDTGDENVKKEMEVSLQAGELVGKLYNAVLKQYKNPDNPESLKSLNMLCVRLVFCMYAEDSGIFGRHNMFHDYLQQFEVQNVRKALIELFKVLDTKDEDRDPYDDTPVSEFPYVNGGLFADENIEIPQFNKEIVALLLNNASNDFNWSAISPTIFGAVFESTLNPDTRRSGGMHYTSIENIHKVIDPLFLDDLKKELDEIKSYKQTKTRNSRLAEFQNKLASLKFLDPACGSGNFLTETYISLRRLENEAIKMRQEGGQIEFDTGEIIKVSIGQFYGIEINDFAVSVAKTALWIAESQMMHETEEIVRMSLDFLPLKSYANIVEGNALRISWESVVPKNEVDFIMGNPPFVGYSLQSKEQKNDILSTYVDENNKPYKTAGKIDYVAGWYFKAAALMENTNIRTALVSTNSITQGEQAAGVWKPLFERFNVHIDFAHKTFRWDSEASLKAHVHCVIVGFSIAENKKDKIIFENGKSKIAKNINPYLIDGENAFIESRSKPICNVPMMTTGNRPADGGNLIIEADEYENFITKEPNAKKYIKHLIGADEFINNKRRYCLWLVGISPAELRSMPLVMNRVEKCRADRLNGAEDRKKLADTPTLFRETNNPDNYIIVPAVSSERRRYVPMGFLGKETISTNLNIIIPDATLYHFGVLTSNVHMAWVRTVCGRLEMRYRYSKDIVYNNFPWCNPTPEQKAKIEQTAQAILDARALYPDCSLADLYDELTMPKELRKAHQNNDRAVMQAYGFDVKTMTESECVGELMKMYRELEKNINNKGEKNAKKKIETIILEKIQPFNLNETGLSKISLLVRQYSYELLLECIDIGISSYFRYDENGKLTEESVNTFLNKLGGIAYNKSLSPIDQEINYIKNKGKSKFSYWNPTLADTLLHTYINELKLFGWSESKILSDLHCEFACMMEKCENWTQWRTNIENWIEDIKHWSDNDNITVEQSGTVLPDALFDKVSSNIQSLCKQINASYENNLYDCTAVIMRRLLEGLLVLSYQKNGIESEIMDKNGAHHITLDKMIKNAAQNSILAFSANTKKDMALFKDLGNYSAHKIWYNCTQQDIKPHILKYRVIIEELMYKAGVK